jgi:hypothetical protein
MKTKLHYLILALLFGFGMNAQTISITGNGTGGWNQPGGVILTSTDATNYTASNFEIIGDGEIKFSEGSWETTGGNVDQPGFPSGTVIINGGKNIKGQLGFWNVSYNIITKAYSFTPGINPNAVIKINGGGLASDVIMNTGNGIAYSKKSLTFTGGDVKFYEEGTSNSWGGAYPEGPVVAGTTIPVPAGTYNVLFVKNTTGPNEFVFEPVVVSLIGNFVGSGWGTDIDLETTDNVIYTKTGWVATPQSEPEVHLKIRDNHDWSTQFGNPAKATFIYSGTAVSVGAEDMYLATGTYDVTFNRSTSVFSFVNTLATKSFATSSFKVFPNPTVDNWSFVSNNDSQINSIQVVDILGKVVLSKKTNSNNVTIDASSLTNGIYFAKVATDATIETVKLIKK